MVYPFSVVDLSHYMIYNNGKNCYKYIVYIYICKYTVFLFKAIDVFLLGDWEPWFPILKFEIRWKVWECRKRSLQRQRRIGCLNVGVLAGRRGGTNVRMLSTLSMLLLPHGLQTFSLCYSSPHSLPHLGVVIVVFEPTYSRFLWGLKD